MWFIWVLTLVLFDISNDVHFGEVLVFGIICDFPRVNYTQKWTSPVNFGYVLFKEKIKIFKTSSKNVFIW